jgi:hypothetical protein
MYRKRPFELGRVDDDEFLPDDREEQELNL